MYVSIVAWDLSNSSATIESLRSYLKDYAVDAFSTLDGMRLKAWFSNAERQLWGAVYVWDSAEHMAGPMRVSRANELIGYPPASHNVFELEAIAEGNSIHASLAGLGRALEGAT